MLSPITTRFAAAFSPGVRKTHAEKTRVGDDARVRLTQMLARFADEPERREGLLVEARLFV